MTPGEINRELDRLAAARSRLSDALIAEGRGEETFNETAKKTDPLSLLLKTNADRHYDLRCEIEVRYGPGAPSRLPHGFKRRKTT